MNHLKTGTSNIGHGNYKNYKYNGKELQETGMYNYGQRSYMPDIGRLNRPDRYSEKYANITPFHYGNNNPIMFNEINGDSIRVTFYDESGRMTNIMPDEVQKMFNQEFGITVGHNEKTGSLYYVSTFDSSLSQSQTATNLLINDLKHKKNKGYIKFGYKLKGVTGSQVDGGMWTSGLTEIDLDDFDSSGKYKNYTYHRLQARAYNLARVFEHEYLGHHFLKLGGMGDGVWDYNLGRVSEQANIYSRERGLPEKLNYGSSATNNMIFFGNTADYQSPKEMRKAVEKMVQDNLNNSYLQPPKR